MIDRINHVLYRGNINKDLRITYIYRYEDGPYCPVMQRETGVTIYPSFAITISEGFEKGHAFFPAKSYFAFVVLLNKSIKLISEHIMELFPDMGKQEFDVDRRTLERFQTEKAMSIQSMTILPTVWVDADNSCYPALNVETLYGSCVIPFEDAICINQMLSTFDPIAFSVDMLCITGKMRLT